MINLKKQLTEPLLEHHVEIKKEEKYSLRILVCFTDGKESPLTKKLITKEKIYLDLREKIGTHIIYAEPHDFAGGLLKSDSSIREKYKIFRQVNSRTKVQLFAHGNFYAGILASEGGHHYSLQEIVSIFKLIEDPSVRVNLSAFNELKRLPQNHLHISVLACHAETFARQLSSGLEEFTANDKRWVASITAGKRMNVMRTHNNTKFNRWHKSYQNCCTGESPKLACAAFLGTATLGLGVSATILGVKHENNALMLGCGSIAAFLLCVISFLAAYKQALKRLHDENEPSSNSKYKVVIHTNFENSKDHFTVLSKDRFKKMMQTEDTFSESKPEMI